MSDIATIPRCRWFRFSLRSLFVLTTVSGLMLGYVVHKQRDSARQLAAAKKAEADFGVMMFFEGRADADKDDPSRSEQIAWRKAGSWLLGSYVAALMGRDKGESSRLGLPDLQDFPELRFLDCRGFYLQDLEPLRKVSGLERVRLEDIPDVKNILPLAGHRKLNSLTISESNVHDLRPLAGLRNLTSLAIVHSPVEDVSPLSGLTKLIDVDLRGTRVADIAPLANLRELTRLGLSFTRVTNVTALAALPKLTELDINGAPITSAKSLQSLRGLQVLWIGKDQFNDEELAELQAALPSTNIRKSEATY